MKEERGFLLALVCATATVGTSVLERVPVLTDLLIGVGVGTLVGKLVVWWREREGAELPARRQRQIELAWIATMAAGAVLVHLAVELI